MKKTYFLFVLVLICFAGTMKTYAQWQDMGCGIPETDRSILSISVVNEQIVWGTAVNSTNFLSPANEFTITVDGGLTWKNGYISDSAINYYPGNIFALSDTVAWVIMIGLPTQDKIRIFKTTNGGLSWQEQTGLFNESGHALAALHFFNENEGVAFGSPGTGDPAIDSLQIYRTADGGFTWYRVPPSQLPVPLPSEGVWIYSGNGSYEAINDNLWFVTRANRVFKTTDRGLTWQAFETGITNVNGLASIAFSDSLHGIVTAPSPQKASRTIDGGQTWTAISIPNLPKAAAIEFIPNTSGTYVISDGFLYNNALLSITSDDGDTWKTESCPPSLFCMHFSSPTAGWGGSEIISSTEGGMYKWTGNLDSLSSGLSAFHHKPVSMGPNPSSGLLFIQMELSSPIDQVIVFDYLGHILKSLTVDGLTQQLDLTALPSGAYYARLKNKGNQVGTCKIIINQD